MAVRVCVWMGVCVCNCKGCNSTRSACFGVIQQNSVQNSVLFQCMQREGMGLCMQAIISPRHAVYRKVRICRRPQMKNAHGTSLKYGNSEHQLVTITIPLSTTITIVTTCQNVPSAISSQLQCAPPHTHSHIASPLGYDVVACACLVPRHTSLLQPHKATLLPCHHPASSNQSMVQRQYKA